MITATNSEYLIGRYIFLYFQIPLTKLFEINLKKLIATPITKIIADLATVKDNIVTGYLSCCTQAVCISIVVTQVVLNGRDSLSKMGLIRYSSG